jgi:hypothetical protein
MFPKPRPRHNGLKLRWRTINPALDVEVARCTAHNHRHGRRTHQHLHSPIFRCFGRSRHRERLRASPFSSRLQYVRGLLCERIDVEQVVRTKCCLPRSRKRLGKLASMTPCSVDGPLRAHSSFMEMPLLPMISMSTFCAGVPVKGARYPVAKMTMSTAYNCLPATIEVAAMPLSPFPSVSTGVTLARLNVSRYSSSAEKAGRLHHVGYHACC